MAVGADVSGNNQPVYGQSTDQVWIIDTVNHIGKATKGGNKELKIIVKLVNGVDLLDE